MNRSIERQHPTPLAIQAGLIPISSVNTGGLMIMVSATSREAYSPYRSMLEPSPIYRPFLHDRVTIIDDSNRPVISLLGVAHCEFRSGPNLLSLASTAAEILGRGGMFGLSSSRYLGFRTIEPKRLDAPPDTREAIAAWDVMGRIC